MNAANLEQTNPLLRGSETWELLEKLSNDELADRLKRITGIFGDQFYVHKGGNMYYGGAACTINKDGRSWIGMTYHPVEIGECREIFKDIVHTRPMDEFLSNKFTMVERYYMSFRDLVKFLSNLNNYTFYGYLFTEGTWYYSFFPVRGEKDSPVKKYKVKVENQIIVESTIDESTVGKSFNQIYKTSVELDQFLTEK